MLLDNHSLKYSGIHWDYEQRNLREQKHNLTLKEKRENYGLKPIYIKSQSNSSYWLDIIQSNGFCHSFIFNVQYWEDRHELLNNVLGISSSPANSENQFIKDGKIYVFGGWSGTTIKMYDITAYC